MELHRVGLGGFNLLILGGGLGGLGVLAEVFAVAGSGQDVEAGGRSVCFIICQGERSVAHVDVARVEQGVELFVNKGTGVLAGLGAVVGVRHRDSGGSDRCSYRFGGFRYFGKAPNDFRDGGLSDLEQLGDCVTAHPFLVLLQNRSVAALFTLLVDRGVLVFLWAKVVAVPTLDSTAGRAKCFSDLLNVRLEGILHVLTFFQLHHLLDDDVVISLGVALAVRHVRSHRHHAHLFDGGRRDNHTLVSGDLQNVQAAVRFEAVEAVCQVEAAIEFSQTDGSLEGHTTFDQVHHVEHVVVVHVGAELGASGTDDGGDFDGGSSHLVILLLSFEPLVGLFGQKKPKPTVR